MSNALKPVVPTLEVCAQAGALLLRAGFEVRHVSMKSEAVYYGLDQRPELLRVATHSSRAKTWGLPGTVVSKLTFNGTGISPPGTMRLHPDKLENVVARAIGIYMLRSGHGQEIKAISG